MDRNFSLNDVLVNAKIEAYQKGIYQPLPIPTEEDSGKYFMQIIQYMH